MSAAAAHSLDRNFQQRIPDLGKAGDVLFDKGVVHGIAAHQPRQDRSQQERIGAGPHRQMQVGPFSGLGTARIDHDHLPVRILADIVEMIARIGKAVGDPGIGADHEQQVAMMHVFGGVAGLAAEHVAVDPEIAGLFLRQRIEDVPRAERAQQRRRVGAAGMVALAAAAIEREALAAVAIHDLAQFRGDLRNRRIPVDRIKTAVGAAAQRRGQAIPVMGVEGDARRLVAEIALRFRIVAVAAHFGDAVVIDQHLEAAIDVAQIAGGFPPVGAGHGHGLRSWVRHHI